MKRSHQLRYKTWLVPTVSIGTFVLSLVLSQGSAVAQQFDTEFSFVAGSDAQPGGPTHDFRIGRFEVTNQQYVDFLHDAIANFDNERGQYMVIDSATGHVHIGIDPIGTITDTPTGTKFFSTDINLAITYDNTTKRYTIVPGLEDHPVVGVSWYGAVKYCNWRTISEGLSLADRVYAEGPESQLDAWRPKTISESDWSLRDLNNQERASLSPLLGYRLPMDGGSNSASPGLYNEWFKAAAWDELAGVDRIFGFGRDTINNTDANFRCSGDAFEDEFDCILGATTPIGYFDGVNLLGDGSTATSDTANSYNLYDLSGNVWEWMQDQSFLQNDRRNRGGSFKNSAAALTTSIEAERAAETVNNATGLRIVQSAPNSLLIVPFQNLAAGGTWGGPYSPNSNFSQAYRITNVTDQTVSYRVTADVPWLSLTLDPLDGSQPTILTGTETLSILSGQVINLTVALDTSCTVVLPVGQQTGTVSFQDLAAGTIAQRTASINLIEPLSAEPSATQTFTMAFGAALPSANITLTNASDTDINWSATIEDTTTPPAGVNWITIGGGVTVDGLALTAGSSIVVALEFDVSNLIAGKHTADIVFTNDCTGTILRRTVSIDIQKPFDVVPDTIPVSTGTCFGDFTPVEQLFTVVNQIDGIVYFRVDLEPIAPATVFDWLDMIPPQGSLATLDEEFEVIARVNSNANSLPPGDYGVRLIFKQLDAPNGSPTGFELARDYSIDVIVDNVTPTTGLTLAGPKGGPFAPSASVYTVQNANIDGLEWSASFDQNWLDVTPSAGIIVNPIGTAAINVSTAAVADTLSLGTYSGTLTINLGPTCLATRTIQLIVGAQSVALDMVNIPADHRQPFGPDYLYRIGKFEVSNAEFVLFLNDTLRNAANQRGAFMTHNSAAGHVTLSGDPLVLLFDASIGGAVSFDPVLNGGEWSVGLDKANWPVVGVSWYAAAKFCNWLTLVQNMSLSQRAYTEGPTTADWRPVTIAATDYALRDLDMNERQLLVDNVGGFRLPMDDESSSASAFNEWYKAAAWLNSQSQNAVYGFGRDTIDTGDANYSASGDPFEPSVTPVGFYGVDGSRLWDDATFGWPIQPPDFFIVLNTDNGYQLHDMTGNVAEWVQDFGLMIGQRGLRGGHYGNALTSAFLRNDTRSSEVATMVSPNIGFRVAQVLAPSDLVVTSTGVRLEGIIGGPLIVDQPGAPAIDIQNPGTQTLDQFSIDVSPTWLDVTGIPPTQLPPTTTINVPLTVNLEPTAANPAAAPPGNFVKVAVKDTLPGGPDYDYWIGQAEVTNAEYVTFLNAALSNASGTSSDGQSEYLYFDTDSGSVYINNQTAGESGTAAPNVDLATRLYDASIGRISYDGTNYVAESGYESHPVVGVSWYGAIKYCNWLTLQDGLPESQRAYSEAPSPNLNQWRPYVTDDASWLPGGFSSTDRASFVRQRLGYRLPMDDESNAASPFNEWYKAASYKGLVADVPTFGVTYGFGRDGPLTDADANFFASGDSQTEGTTSVRFFNGDNVLFADAGTCSVSSVPQMKTANTDNGYNLYDVTGNVAEWMQDFGTTANDRSVRGGSWRDFVDSPNLMITTRSSQPAATTNDKTGFRIVRSTGTLGAVTVTDTMFSSSQSRHFILDVDEPIELSPRSNATWTWTYGDSSATPSLTMYTLLNTSDTLMDWQIDLNATWVNMRLEGSVETNVRPLSGTIASSATFNIEFLPASSAADLLPGDSTATITFTNELTGITQSRNIELTVNPPASVIITSMDAGMVGSFSGQPGGPFFVFEGAPAQTNQLSLTLQNDAGIDLTYAMSVDQTWLTIEPIASLSGTLLGSAGATPVTFLANLTVDADTLPVGKHEAIVSADLVDPTNPTVSISVSQTLMLDIRDWLTVTQPNEPWDVAGNLDANALPTQLYTLQNNAPDPIEIQICVDQTWLESDTSQVEIFPGNTLDIAITLTLDALALPDGRHDARIVLRNLATGVETLRHVRRTVDENILISPVSSFSTGGIAGQSITPLATVYTISSASEIDVDWSVAVEYVTPSDPAWLLLNGLMSTSGTIAPQSSTSLTARIDTAQTVTLNGVHDARIVFTDLATGRSFVRDVSLTLSTPTIAIAESIIPPVPPQPNGPSYTYAMAPLATTNAQFVAFLNDAIANSMNERGQYMFFDNSTGDVYVNFSVVGETGSDIEARTIKMFSPMVAGQILFDGVSYSVAATPVNFSQHPVTGVSWYGAAKYCNWLTLDQGLLPNERCYREATAWELDRWKPMGITDTLWTFRSLIDAERSDLVQNYRGFRLPMDDGFDNATSSVDTSDAYNEWYKAAAWDPITGVNRLYGFGRDVMMSVGPNAGMDANYKCSGDPFENAIDCLIGSTTPVGFFDGPNQLASFVATANENAFGLFDLTGNTYEWMQDQHRNNPGSVNFRAVRGGSFNDSSDSDSFKTTFRAVAPVSMTSNQIGFRTVRAIQAATIDADGDGDIDAADALQMLLALLGPGQPTSTADIVYDIDFDGDVDLADLAELQRLFSGSL